MNEKLSREILDRLDAIEQRLAALEVRMAPFGPIEPIRLRCHVCDMVFDTPMAYSCGRTDCPFGVSCVA